MLACVPVERETSWCLRPLGGHWLYRGPYMPLSSEDEALPTVNARQSMRGHPVSQQARLVRRPAATGLADRQSMMETEKGGSGEFRGMRPSTGPAGKPSSDSENDVSLLPRRSGRASAVTCLSLRVLQMVMPKPTSRFYFIITKRLHPRAELELPLQAAAAQARPSSTVQTTGTGQQPSPTARLSYPRVSLAGGIAQLQDAASETSSPAQRTSMQTMPPRPSTAPVKNRLSLAPAAQQPLTEDDSDDGEDLLQLRKNQVPAQLQPGTANRCTAARQARPSAVPATGAVPEGDSDEDILASRNMHPRASRAAAPPSFAFPQPKQMQTSTPQPVTLQLRDDSDDDDAQLPTTASQRRASKAQTAVQSGRGKRQSMAEKQLASRIDPTSEDEEDGNAAALRSSPVSHISVASATAAAPAARPSQAARLSGLSGMGRKQESIPGSEQPGVGQPHMQKLAALCTVHWQHLKS